MTHFNKICESGSSSFLFQRTSFSKEPAACRGRPPCEFNHWHFCFPSKPVRATHFLHFLWEMSSIPKPSGGQRGSDVQSLAQCRTVTINKNWPLQKTTCRRQMDCFMSNTWEKPVSLTIKHPRNHCTNKPTNAKFTQPTTVLKLIFTQSFPKSTAAYLTAEGQQA